MVEDMPRALDGAKLLQRSRAASFSWLESGDRTLKLNSFWHCLGGF